MPRHNNNPAILSPTRRHGMLRAWLCRTLSLADADLSLAPLSGDAGNRIYYRLRFNRRRLMVTDDSSPRQVRRYLAVRNQFAAAGVTVPALTATDNGFLLQEDFGDRTYWRALLADDSAADKLYAAACRMLIKIQHSTGRLPLYSEALLRREMRLFADWYCRRHLRRPLSAAGLRVFAQAADFLQAALRQMKQAPVHRDYHSRNLMLLADDTRSPGVLDFQDAVRGAAVYDIVSLLRDAYLEWPVERQRRWLMAYRREAQAAGGAPADSDDELWEHFNIAGAQRGLKVLGIFARLCYRDKKTTYLGDLARVHRHLTTACADIPALQALATLIADYAPPADE